MTPLEALVVGVLLTLFWLLIGTGMVAIWRRDLASETLTALLNTVLWPAGVVAQGIVWPIYRWRRERARQARLTAKVESGEYAVEHARNLGWKG